MLSIARGSTFLSVTSLVICPVGGVCAIAVAPSSTAHNIIRFIFVSLN
jgi:hypothetical protein